MTHKPARSFALRGVATVALVAFTSTIPAGCGNPFSFLKSKMPDVPGLPSAPSLNLSADNMALMKAMGPVAIVAIALVADAIAKNMAEQRAAEAAEDERQRVKMAAAELFYADTCGKGAGEKAEKPTGEVAEAEAKAEAAFAKGDFAGAADSLRIAREAQTKLSGDNSPEVARLSNREATVQLAQGDFAAAMLPALKSHKIRSERLEEAKKKEAEKSVLMTCALDVAESQSTLGQIYLAAGVMDQASISLTEALEHRSGNLGADHLCVAASQNSLAELKQTVGAFGEGFDLLRKSLATRKKHLSANHRDLAQSYNNIGTAYRAMALYTPAKENYNKALEIRKELGPDHPDVADSLHSLGSLYKAMGDYPAAEDHYERALRIREQKLGEGIELAQSENALGDLYFETGDYDKAEVRLKRALAVRKKKLSANHPQIADSLESLSHLYQAKGDMKQAESSLREAIDIWKTKFGPEHPAVARGLASLGELQVATGRYDDAEKQLLRAREIRQAKLGAEHPDTATSIHQLGVLAYARRDYKKAETLFRQASDLRKKKLGSGHAQVAVSFSYLAATLVALDKTDEALSTFTEAQRISEELVRNVGTTSTESRLEALLRFMRAQEEVVYSLLSEPKLAQKAAPLALSVALLRKGRSVDEAAASSRALHGDLPPQQQAMAEELRALRSEIAYKKLSTSASVSANVDKETERAEKLEQELSRVSAPFRSKQTLPAPDQIVKQVASALGPEGVLVEVLAYRQYDFRAKAKAPRWGGVRYAALVLDGKGKVSTVELGAQSDIDKKVTAFLKETTDAGPASQAGAQELSKSVVAPLAPALTKAKRVFLSLDGQLNLVPFWALSDGKDMLIDKWELVYLTSGRDLLRAASKDSAGAVAILAKPEFVKGAPKQKDDTRGLELVTLSAGTTALVTGKKEDGGLRLKYAPSPLAGTEKEAQAIGKLIPSAKIFKGTAATKQKLLSLQSPVVLHVATHGLFKPEPASFGKTRGLSLESGLAGDVANGKQPDPLLNSMLLMTNAGHMASDGGEGVTLDPNGLATALEMAGMNLWGTQLVVLSACESGRGQVDKLGQGVYGLRRALVVAGAETLVTSLWKVDDEVTRDMMTLYYRNLLKGQGRVEALRAAAITIRQKHPEPRHWAPFIAIGQVGPLRGVEGK